MTGKHIFFVGSTLSKTIAIDHFRRNSEFRAHQGGGPDLSQPRNLPLVNWLPKEGALFGAHLQGLSNDQQNPKQGHSFNRLV